MNMPCVEVSLSIDTHHTFIERFVYVRLNLSIVITLVTDLAFFTRFRHSSLLFANKDYQLYDEITLYLIINSIMIRK